MDKKIEIPYNETGKESFELLKRMALEKLTRARKAMKDFILVSFPGSMVVSEKIVSGIKYFAVIETPSKSLQIATYDFATKTIKIIQKENKLCSSC